MTKTQYRVLCTINKDRFPKVLEGYMYLFTYIITSDFGYTSVIIVLK
ncbi:MAG: hypothetical protein ACI3Y0_12500 [Prevotella sp.]